MTGIDGDEGTTACNIAPLIDSSVLRVLTAHAQSEAARALAMASAAITRVLENGGPGARGWSGDSTTRVLFSDDSEAVTPSGSGGGVGAAAITFTIMRRITVLGPTPPLPAVENVIDRSVIGGGSSRRAVSVRFASSRRGGGGVPLPAAPMSPSSVLQSAAATAAALSSSSISGSSSFAANATGGVALVKVPTSSPPHLNFVFAAVCRPPVHGEVSNSSFVARHGEGASTPSPSHRIPPLLIVEVTAYLESCALELSTQDVITSVSPPPGRGNSISPSRRSFASPSSVRVLAPPGGGVPSSASSSVGGGGGDDDWSLPNPMHAGESGEGAKGDSVESTPHSPVAGTGEPPVFIDMSGGASRAATTTVRAVDMGVLSAPPPAVARAAASARSERLQQQRQQQQQPSRGSPVRGPSLSATIELNASPRSSPERRPAWDSSKR